MLTDTTKWSHARGNTVVPSRWQATSGKRVGQVVRSATYGSAKQFEPIPGP